MNRDDVIRMAREAGLLIPSSRIDGGLALGACTVPDFERFASLVAAAEREACAKVCEGRIGGAIKEDAWWSGFKSAMSQCAEIIRARGKI